METRITKPIVRVMLVALLIISLFSFTAFDSPPVAYAAGENAVNFDSTNVMDDLNGSALNGVPFDVADYPYDKDGELQVLGFVEYCYSEYENLRGNYGLYLYIYNPALLDIATGTGSNRITMATEYNAEGMPAAYNKFALQFCGVSDGVEANRFWKFKIADSAYFLDKVNVNARSYYVSGVEIQTYGSGNASEIAVATQYIFTGFAKGYSQESEDKSTLKGSAEMMETVEISGLLDRQTVYRTDMSNPNMTSHNQVNGVYFALDDELVERYGKLQKIKAEWWEYRTTPIIVTNNQGIVNTIDAWLGVLMGTYNSSLSYGISTGYYYHSNPGFTSIVNYSWTYNMNLNNSGTIYTTSYESDEICEKLSWILYENAASLDNNYNVDAAKLTEFMAAYNERYPNRIINEDGVRYNSDLLSRDVGEGRNAGHNVYEFDAEDDSLEFKVFDPDDHTYTSWERLMAAFGWSAESSTALAGQSPILLIDKSNFDTMFSGSLKSISDRLLISETEVNKFKNYCETEVLEKGNTVVHFRFACTQYDAAEAEIWNDNGRGNQIDCDAFMAQQNVFLNFDIISLTFNDDGEYRVLPVISDPIDIVSDLTGPQFPPEEPLEGFISDIAEFFENIGDWFKDNWKWIVIGVACVIGLVVFGLIVKLIVGMRGNKVKIKVDPSPSRLPSRGSSKRK